MKRAFIIHGWGGNSAEAWLPWLKEELESKGIAATTPDMPDTDRPKIDDWVNFLSGLVGSANKDTYFVGHSIGCQAIARYLSILPDGASAGGVILVAPWMNLTNLDQSEDIQIAKPWVETPIDWDAVKRHCTRSVVIYSDNDPYVPIGQAKTFGNNLNAKLILESNRGHFSDSDDVTQIPVLLNELLNMVNA